MSRVTAQCPYEYAHPGKCKPCCSTVAVQLFIMGPNYCLLRPSHLDCACLSLVASLSALPSSLLGADLYLHHPALLGPNHLSSFFSFLSSLATAHFSDRISHLSLRPLNQATESLSNCIPLCLTIPGPAECAKRLNNNIIIIIRVYVSLPCFS